MQSKLTSMPFEILSEPPKYVWNDVHSRFICGDPINVREILPYKKSLMQLNSEQLNRIFYEARVNAWKVLDLSNCKIDKLPDEIGKLIDIEVLVLGTENDHPQYFNTFNKLPDTIADMVNLKVLVINNVPLTELPNSLSKLINLQFLDICGNKCFAVFPEVVYKLTNLRVLRISYNTSIKRKVKPYAVSNEISMLKLLQRFFITGDGFVALSDEIGMLQHLEHLSISRTQIKSLPETITKSNTLKELILYENNIGYLPKEIGDVSSLTTLRLNGEPIDFIPASIRKLHNLKEFIVENTPLERKLPPSIQKQSPESMIMFLLDMQNDETIKAPPNESKMIIVGQGGVGKTSLLKRLVYNTFEENLSTEGIDIVEWQISNDVENTDETKVLRIWDFGGQEIYHATHQIFLSERSLYVLVWDARQDNEYGRIEYWLNTINLYAKGSPIFLVVNKCDGLTPEPKIDIEKYKERYETLQLPLYKISCMDNKNIDELREHIKKRANELPLMHQQWPKSWITVRGFLQELYRINDKHYIDYDGYLEICKNNNMDDNDAENLIRCLHDLGIVLCFRSDNKLNRWVVLEKEWGTKAIYKVLNYRGHNNGIINNEDLKDIWTDRKVYPVDMYPFLLRLMFHFQISFKIDHRFLVAELLKYTSIAMPEGFSAKEALHFRCQYVFLPAGVMTRFIVASHEYLLEANGCKLCWFKGAYLIDGKGSRAKIELFDDVSERYIDIRIWNQDKECAKDFLNKIRLILMDINASIPNVSYEEMMRCNCEPGCVHFFSYNLIFLYKNRGRKFITCNKSISEVDVNRIMSDYGL